MSTLKINFNYIYPEVQFLKPENGTKYYDMKDFCEWLISCKELANEERPKMNIPLANGEFAGIEWKDCEYDENNKLYYFRLKRLRSKNIPAFSYSDNDSTDIDLDDNEYLGEFNLVIFDPGIKRLIVQNNFFGLSLGQIATTLTAMRINRLSYIKKSYDESDPGSVELKLILDKESVNKIRNNKIFRSYELSLADVKALKEGMQGKTDFDKIVNLADEVDGVSINVKVSLSRKPKNKTLKKTKVMDLIRKTFKINDPDKAKMTVKTRKSINDSLDEINVLVPKLVSTIELKNVKRSTIGAEYVYNNFIEQNYLNETMNMRKEAQKDSV